MRGMTEADVFDPDLAAIVRELAREYARLNATYFRDRLQPIPLSLGEDRSRYGCFVRDPRRIELARALVLEQPWGIVVEVLKHEMAHQYVAEVLGEVGETSHGPTFQSLCDKLGIDGRATGLPSVSPEHARIVTRIQKLFALAGSSNQHEAEAAMRMAHRLMLKHNLEHASRDAAASAFGFRHLGKPTGRASEAEWLLSGLLGEFFFVHPIWVPVYRVSDHKRANVLEITGRHENLDMAEYVYAYLQRASESLWSEHKRKRGIARDTERRAFLAGVMRGFGEKLRSERKSAQSTGLVWVSDPLADQHFRRRHPRIRTTSRSTSTNSEASHHGRAAGRELVLNRPLESTPGRKPRLLPG